MSYTKNHGLQIYFSSDHAFYSITTRLTLGVLADFQDAVQDKVKFKLKLKLEPRGI